MYSNDMTDIVNPKAYELAYESGVNALNEHASALRETRDRAGKLLSTAAIAGGAGAGLAFNAGWTPGVDSAGRIGAIVALAGFVFVTVATVRIWWPVEMVISFNPAVIVGSYIEDSRRGSLAELQRDLALWLGQHAEANLSVLKRTLHWFSVGLLMLVAEIAGIGYMLWVALG